MTLNQQAISHDPIFVSPPTGSGSGGIGGS